MAHQAYDDSANRQVALAHHDRLHRRVGRLQPHLPARFAVELLDGRLVADQGDHGFAVVGAVAAFDDYVIAVADAVFDHRVALHAQAEGIVPADEIVGHGDRLVVLDRFDWRAGRNGAEQPKRPGRFTLLRPRHLERAAMIVLPL